MADARAAFDGAPCSAARPGEPDILAPANNVHFLMTSTSGTEKSRSADERREVGPLTLWAESIAAGTWRMASATDATPVREKVAVLGLGRLGLCFAVVLEQAGYDVVGMDVNPSIVEEV
jgi:glutamate dehydrogenase/leucine dehydrogenase